MQSLIDDLYTLVRINQTQALAAVLSTYLIPQIQDAINLQILEHPGLQPGLDNVSLVSNFASNLIDS